MLLLGAGGTAKAISLALQQSDIKVTILNRSEEKLRFFEEHNMEATTWNKFKIKDFDLIVNSTSAGLKDEDLPCPIEILNEVSKYKICLWLLYGKQHLSRIAKR